MTHEDGPPDNASRLGPPGIFEKYEEQRAGVENTASHNHYTRRKSDAMHIELRPTSGRLLTLEVYMEQVVTTVRSLIDVIITVFKRSHSAIYRTEQMVKQVDSTFEVLNELNVTAEETSLLALNVFFDAAKSGSGAKGTMSLAEEVKKLSEHSITFTTDIKSEIELAKKSINDVKEQIGDTADKELDLAIKTKELVDQKLGGMIVLEEVLISAGSNVAPLLRQKIVEELASAVSDISLGLALLDRRVNIIKSKQAVSEEEVAYLDPVLAISGELQDISVEIVG